LLRPATAGSQAIDKQPASQSNHIPGVTSHQHHAGGIGFLALTALGVVFGDIGTSPLYAFSIALSATGHTVPTPADVRGIVSLIFWALMIMVSLKYVQLVLRADNDGEGGILALLALVEGDRLAVGLRISLPMILGILGASLLYGDGVITPAISVLSAMEGLKLAAPGFASFVLPVTLGILVGLFTIQSQGTHRIGRLFGPVMVIWFLVIALLGAVNIAAAPGIVTALNPLAAVPVLTGSPAIAAGVFGAIFLALTGGEALYADMGHVGAPAIRLAWFGLVVPALVLNYLGQGALILADPGAADSPFYKLAPGWLLVPLIVLAAAATVIASQALISGVFSLTRQAMQMGFAPRVAIVPTSSDEAGQIYVPTANWLLMAGTLLIVVTFRTSDNLGSAYGVAVSGTMLATTVLLFYLVTRRWHWPLLAAVPVIAVFGAVARGTHVVLAAWHGGGAAPVARNVDADCRFHEAYRRFGGRPGGRHRGLVDQGGARHLADAAALRSAQCRAASDGRAAYGGARPSAAGAVPRTPYREASRTWVSPHHRAAWVHAAPRHSDDAP
jgi:KUP system potassium uptake protein